jgi:hypothetical protein
LSRAPVSVVSSFLYGQPLLAGLIAWLWLGQTMGMLAIVGGALTLVGVALTVRGARKPVVAVPAPVAKPALAKLCHGCVALWHGVQIQLR